MAIRYEHITPARLEALINDPAYDRMPAIPISRQRAWSQLRNPRAGAEDVLLVLAWEEAEMVGYLGVVPDRLYLNGKEHRVGWMSCIWVDPRQRGKGIAGELVRQVFQAWDDRIIVTEFTPQAKRLYDKLGSFFDVNPPPGIRGYLRFNLAKLLPARRPSLRRWRPLLRLTDSLLNLPNALRLAFWRPHCRLSWEYMAEIDAEAAAFIEAHQAGELTRRGQSELNWLLKHPWVLSGPVSDAQQARYHFTALAERFEFIALRLRDEAGNMAGLLVLSVRDRHLRVPYAYLTPAARPEAARLIWQHMLRMRMDMLTLHHPELVETIRHMRSPFWLIRPFRTAYILSTRFAGDYEAQGELRIQDGDGDKAFT
ncbi:MAG: GNAT family N-acetyltransferase [Bacteroidetes bacterium]|nr:MAG: GNAT family N-acetyltransferase [Bacteroidota bacterium]